MLEEITKDVDYIILIEKEKRARLDNEILEGSIISVQLLEFIWTKYGVANVPSIFLSISKKRNQSKKTLTEMIKVIFDRIYPTCVSQDEQIKILRSIMEITEGKMYVEFEYSVAVRKLTEILLGQGNLEEACKLIQDIQIETFGSLDKVYKVEYILFQIKVLLQKGDFVRTLIVSNKIIRKHLEEKDLHHLKIEFYLLMIKYYVHEEKYYEAAKCYQILYDFYTKSINNRENIDENNNKLLESLSNLSGKDLFDKFIFMVNISPPTNDTKEKIIEIKKTYFKELDAEPTINNLITFKTGDDIIALEDNFLNQFTYSSIFKDNDSFYILGKVNIMLFRKYCIQHNISIFCKFYNQVFLKRISELLKIDVEEVEQEICDMVMNKFIYAKINRIKGTVSFRPKQTFERKSDSLNNDLTKMLETLERTCHLIHKENLKYGIKS